MKKRLNVIEDMSICIEHILRKGETACFVIPDNFVAKEVFELLPSTTKRTVSFANELDEDAKSADIALPKSRGFKDKAICIMKTSDFLSLAKHENPSFMRIVANAKIFAF